MGVSATVWRFVHELIEDHRIGLTVGEQDGKDLLGAAVGVVHIGFGVVTLTQLTTESVGVLVEPWLEVGKVLIFY
jgi:hypothetical protein